MATLEHPALLVVLDGWGHSDNLEFNAIEAANTPQWDRMLAECPHSLLECSGLRVGLPEQQMGNSEVGHMHLGAGRLIYQDFTRISQAVKQGELFSNPILQPAFARAAAAHRAVHLMGLLSPGGVHSHVEHILALHELARRTGVTNVFIHAFLDGRDTPPKSAAASLQLVAERCTVTQLGRIASIIGRYYAMDRNKSWERTQQAYALLTDGIAPYHAADALGALDQAYARDETDEFVKATAIHPAGESPVRIIDGDLLVFANFRADRARQLTSAFTAPNFAEFPRQRVPQLAEFISLTDYGAQFKTSVAYPTVEIRNTFGEILAQHKLRQLRIAETEKYAHVTFFFNGGEEQPFAGEERILVPSPAVATYDLKPEMSAVEVTDQLVAAIRARRFDAIVCNFANADMVGHTGNLKATIKCIEVLDACLGRVRTACAEAAMDLLITADHGNAEQMRALDGDGAEPHTAHTSNLVPLVYCGRDAELLRDGCLSDIAPTLLTLMGLTTPREMTGHSLLKLKTAARAHSAA